MFFLWHGLAPKISKKKLGNIDLQTCNTNQEENNHNYPIGKYFLLIFLFVPENC